MRWALTAFQSISQLGVPPYTPKPASGERNWFAQPITQVGNIDTTLNANGFSQIRTSAMMEGDSEPTGTTKIVNDGETVKAAMQDQVKLGADLLTAASTGQQQDILSFLSKPYPIQTGQLATTDTSGTFPINQLFKSVLDLDIYKQKIKGHMGIRATVVLRVQLNADRFMQGRYILAFMPFVAPGVGGYNNSALRSKQMRASRMTVTQLPHVQFDLNCDTEAILEIPYVSTYSHYSISTGEGDVGSYFLYPYSPFVTGTTGSTLCQYTIWCSLKDVELVAPMVPQSNFEFQMARPSGRTSKGSVEEQEQRSGGIGPVEGVLKKVSKAADVVAQIPILSMVASQVSWSADILARAANVFGFSKPIDLATPMKMVCPQAPFWNNPDMPDQSLPLAVMAKNSIEGLPGFAGSNTDEMSIDYLKTIPAYYRETRWRTTDQTGDNLFTQVLSPQNFFEDFLDGAISYRTMVPMTWLSTMFRNYRGSIRLTFKIVKTEFHSGRLVLSFNPSQGAPNGIYSLQSSTYLHREILDIRMGNEFSFVLPYASLQTYRAMDKPYGVAVIHVLNELVAPASVSDYVNILVEASAAPDMEFQFPVGVQLTPYVPMTTQSNFEFQMDRPECSVDQGMLADSAMFDDKLASARYCSGEKILSLNSLLKRSSWWVYTFDVGTHVQWTIYPYCTSASGTVEGSFGKDNIRADWYSMILPAFALSRGGVRVKMIAPGNRGRCDLYHGKPNYQPYDTIVWDNFGDAVDLANYSYGNTPGVFFRNDESPLEVSVPQYGRFHSRVNQELIVGPDNAPFNQVSPTVPDMVVYIELQNGPAQPTFFRAVSDDFQCGYFTGVPPFLLGT